METFLFLVNGGAVHLKIHAVIFLLIGLLSFVNCTPDPKDYPELEVKELEIGRGDTVGGWDSIKVHFTGKFTDGRIFDSTEGKEARSYNMRSRSLIMGWRVGIQGMKVGGKRRLIIPPSMAFGEKGKFGSIPPNATLIFDIHLVGIE